MSWSRIGLIGCAAVLALVACDEPSGTLGGDTGQGVEDAARDTSAPDAGVVDAATRDARPADRGAPPDAQPSIDVGPRDQGAPPADAGIADAAPLAPDLSPPDAAIVDAAPAPDLSPADVGIVDAAPLPRDLSPPDAMPQPTCEDGERNGGEVDVDCAGPCDPCPDGRACALADDCASGVCAGDVCQAPRCGDGVIQAGEGCDDGDAITNPCAANAGPCVVCTADCQDGPGIQDPAPRVWDGEAGDGLWETAANWDPDGVPGIDEWVVVGGDAEVTADMARCRHLTIEPGAVVSQGARGLGCDLRIAGTFVPSAQGHIPGGRTWRLEGELGARVPWIDSVATRFEFVDGARLLNPNMLLRVRNDVRMTFEPSAAGFTPIVAGSLLEPATWAEIAVAVDLSRYDAANGSRLVLLDFARHDPNFAESTEVDVELLGDGPLEGRVFWDAPSSQLQLVVGPRQPPADAVVRLIPAEPTVLDTLRAEVLHDHPTARPHYAWFHDDVPLDDDGARLDLRGRVERGDTLRVEVTLTTTGGEAGPFVAVATVGNSPPVIERLTITPASPTVAEALAIEVDVRDPDGGAAQLADCRWQAWSEFAGWSDLPGEEGEALAACAARDGCGADQRVRVRCRATDGVATSAWFTSPTVVIRAADCDDADPACAAPAFGGPPTVDPRDYSYWYWPANHRPVEIAPAYARVFHILTGHYGLAFDEETGALPRFGWLADGQSTATARQRPNADVGGLPAARVAFEAGPADAPAVAQVFRAGEGGTDDRALMTDGGRFMNFIELPHVEYANAVAPIDGKVELAAMPRHVVFNHTVDVPIARVRLSGPFLDALDQVEWLAPDRAVRLGDADGRGWLFVVYGDTTLALEDGELVAEHTIAAAGTAHTVSLLAAPLTALDPVALDLYVHPEATADVAYTLLDRSGAPARAPVAVPWDPRLGAFRATLGTLAEAGLGGARNYDQRPELHSWYGRHRITVDTHERGPLALPLAFFATGGASLSITGGAASLRDARGEPVGVPVQISKNWHDRRVGAWYHFYTQPRFAGLEPQTLELTIASSRWGADAYAASHAQLSLIGWNNAGGHWDESALGAFGESITYDPDLALGRAMVDDVRPLLVQARDRWSWTGNVGGADFLRYRMADAPGILRRLGRVRSTYHAYGPNLTDVEYSGISSDGRIQADVRVQMGRTDDLVRTWFHLDYTFLEDVRYERLAFFQMAADRYGDNGFARAAWGNADGVVADRAIPDHRTTGYAAAADRGIPLAGDAPWVMLYDNQRIDERLPEHFADLAYVVRAFRADIGGVRIDTPHLSLHRTFNGNSQFGLELGLPFAPGAPWCGAPCQGDTVFIPAGSTVRATIEYLVAPADKAVYYGASDYLEALPAEQWRTPAMAQRLAAGNDLAVVAATGAVRRRVPVEIDAAAGSPAAEFILDGGLGYVPVTIHGLPRHDGWRLQIADDAGWTEVDQSVHGNDYWQAAYDGETDTYALTFNVPNRGTQRYRLVWLRHCPAEDGGWALCAEACAVDDGGCAQPAIDAAGP